MRTKQEYQDALLNLTHASKNYAWSKYGTEIAKDIIEQYEIDEHKLQELIDNLGDNDEKVYVEETETIYVDINKMIEKYKESKDE